MFLWHAVGYLEQHLLFYRSPLVKWHLAGCGLLVLGRSWLGVVCWGGVLCENCIVDANAIIMAMAMFVVVVCFSFLWFLFLVFFVVCA